MARVAGKCRRLIFSLELDFLRLLFDAFYFENVRRIFVLNIAELCLTEFGNWNTPLTRSTTDLLSKGLEFIPSPRPTHFYNSFHKYRRNMHNELNTSFGIITPQFTPPELALASSHHHHLLTTRTSSTVKLSQHADFVLRPLLQNIHHIFKTRQTFGNVPMMEKITRTTRDITRDIRARPAPMRLSHSSLIWQGTPH